MKNELITIEAQEFNGIEKSKAQQIRDTFLPMSVMLESFEAAFTEIMAEKENGITTELTAKAKRLRLDISRVRIDTGKLKDDQKKYLLQESNAIQGVHNILVHAVSEKEDKLKEIEKHFENQEKERLNKLQLDRVAQLDKYVEDAAERNLSLMEDDVWDAYLTSKKNAYNDRIEAEKKAEAERVENERLDKVQRDRQIEIAPYIQFLSESLASQELRTKPENEYKALISELQNAKIAHDKKQAEIQAENERLKKQTELAEAKAAKEKQDREAKEAADIKKREDKTAKEKQEQKNKDDKEKRINESAKARQEILFEIGVNLDFESCKRMEESVWSEFFDMKNNEYQKEQNRLSIEKLKAESEAKKERERVEKLEADAKELRDAQAKKEADAKAKEVSELKAAEKAKKDAELAPDKIKLEKLRDAIISLEMPNVTSAEAKEVIRKVKVLLGKTETFINEQKDSL